jgi:hypothetical protein
MVKPSGAETTTTSPADVLNHNFDNKNCNGAVDRRSGLWRETSKTPLARAFIILAVFLIGMITQSVIYRVTSPEKGAPSELERLEACIKSVGTDASFDAGRSTNVMNYCYARIARGEMLEDYLSRRAAFTVQRLSAEIVLVLLVLMTTCGIGLAGLQLVFAYRLASRGRAGFTDSTEATIAQKASIRSSVSGVIIVAAGLTFFILWTKMGFTLTESQTAPTDTPPSSALHLDMTAPQRPPAVLSSPPNDSTGR